MVRRRHLQFDAGEFGECLPKTRYKQLIVVRDDVEGQAVFAVPTIKENDGKILSHNTEVGRDNADIRIEAIRHRHYAIITFVDRQRSNEIDGNTVPLRVRNQQRVQRTREFGSP